MKVCLWQGTGLSPGLAFFNVKDNMIEARIIEEIKQIIAAGLKDVPDDQILEIMPKINTAINVYCVDKIIELTKMDEA